MASPLDQLAAAASLPLARQSQSPSATSKTSLTRADFTTAAAYDEYRAKRRKVKEAERDSKRDRTGRARPAREREQAARRQEKEEYQRWHERWQERMRQDREEEKQRDKQWEEHRLALAAPTPHMFQRLADRVNALLPPRLPDYADALLPPPQQPPNPPKVVVATKVHFDEDGMSCIWGVTSTTPTVSLVNSPGDYDSEAWVLRLSRMGFAPGHRFENYQENAHAFKIGRERRHSV